MPGTLGYAGSAVALLAALVATYWTSRRVTVAWAFMLAENVTANTVAGGVAALRGVVEVDRRPLEDTEATVVTAEPGEDGGTDGDAVPFLLDTRDGQIRVDPRERTSDGDLVDADSRDSTAPVGEDAVIDLPTENGARTLTADTHALALGIATNTLEHDDGPPVLENRRGDPFRIHATAPDETIGSFVRRTAAGGAVAFVLFVLALAVLP